MVRRSMASVSLIISTMRHGARLSSEIQLSQLITDLPLRLPTVKIFAAPGLSSESQDKMAIYGLLALPGTPAAGSFVAPINRRASTLPFPNTRLNGLVVA